MNISRESHFLGLATGDPLRVVLDDLRALATDTVPAPSARLAELLVHGVRTTGATGVIDAPAAPARATPRSDRIGALLALVPAAELARRNRVGRLVAAAVVAIGATLGLTGVAAANDALPEPATSLVRSVVNNCTSFHIGPPVGHDKPHARPAPVRPVLPRFSGAAMLHRPAAGRSVTGAAHADDAVPAAARQKAPDPPAADSAPPAGGSSRTVPLAQVEQHAQTHTRSPKHSGAVKHRKAHQRQRAHKHHARHHRSPRKAPHRARGAVAQSTAWAFAAAQRVPDASTARRFPASGPTLAR